MVFLFAVFTLLFLAFAAIVIIVLGVAGLMAGSQGIRAGGVLVSVGMIWIAAIQAYACGWSFVALIVPLPRADDWQERMTGCDAPAGFLAASLVGPMLICGVAAVCFLTWWMERRAPVRGILT